MNYKDYDDEHIYQLDNDEYMMMTESQYEKTNILTESIETALSVSPFKKEMTLYHGRIDKQELIKPVSKNYGTRFSNPRLSSFWTKKIEFAKSFALFRLLENLGYISVFDKDMNICMDDIVYRKMISKIRKNDLNLYIYKKTFHTKDLGRGHSQYIDEYTFDLPVRPDDEIVIGKKDVLEMIKGIKVIPKIVWDDFLEEMSEYYKNMKGSLIYYSHKHYLELHERYKTYKESVDEIFYEDAIGSTTFLRDRMVERVDKVLSDPKNVRKFNQLVNAFINKNITKLTKSGPCDMIPFTDNDHKAFHDLFGFWYTIDKRPKVTSPNEVRDIVTDFCKFTKSKQTFIQTNSSQLLFYFVIRYFTIHRDAKSLNAALSIYALIVYPLMFHKYFKLDVNEAVMKYTIDNLTDKFIFKKSKHLFGALMASIQNSYSFHKNNFKDAKDDKIIAFIQRIRNDQNSLFKKLCNEYMKNYEQGNYARQSNEEYDTDTPIVDEISNASTEVQNIVQKVTYPIIEDGIDLVRAEAAAKMSGVSVSDCRHFLTLILNDKNVERLQKFIEALMFLYIYEEHKTVRDIKSRYFLAWAASLFKKTNSKNKNIGTINEILNYWAEETGIYKKFAREASRINYKKAIFFYIVLCIQKSC